VRRRHPPREMNAPQSVPAGFLCRIANPRNIADDSPRHNQGARRSWQPAESFAPRKRQRLPKISPTRPETLPFATSAGLSPSTPIPGHFVPHPLEYHQEIYDRLVRATRGSSGEEYARKFREEMEAIRTELTTVGSYLNGKKVNNAVLSPDGRHRDTRSMALGSDI
jgi:hypothetical protein